MVVNHYGSVLAQEFEEVAIAVELEAEGERELHVLIDVRGVDDYPTKGEYLYWLQNRPRLSPIISSSAIVCDEKCAEIIDFQVLVSRSSGMAIRRFCDTAEAMTWLTRKPE